MDDSQALYAKDSVTRLIELLQGQFGSQFNSYWEDMPLAPPTKEEYPALIVQKLDGTVSLGPTQTDELTEIISITLFKAIADAVGSANVKTTAQRELQLMVEGQDPTTLQYKPDTILSVIRTNLTLRAGGVPYIINDDVKLHYGIEPSSQGNIAFATVMLSTWRRVIVPWRQ